MSTLEIKDLHVSVILDDETTKPILKGVNLTINSATRSTQSWARTVPVSPLWLPPLPATPSTRLTPVRSCSTVRTSPEMSVDERARAGLFLAMQYPVEIPGVTMSNFLRSAKTAVDGKAPSLRTWTKDVKEAMKNLEIDPDFIARNVNEGFSGGEKKRHEILQLELLKPKFGILDETDSGLDVDALKIVSEGVNRAHDENDMGVMLITHYTRILRYIKPQFVHVFVDGKMVDQGGPELADRLEEEGYVSYVGKK